MTSWAKPGYERIYAKIEPEPTSGCWLWSGALHSDGYGSVWFGARTPAHRVVYELERGPIPKGLQLDHLCRNRACVNPDHLEPVTQYENALRGIRVRRDGLCRKCGSILSMSLAGPKSRARDGYRMRCQPCNIAYHRDRRAKKLPARAYG